MGATADTGSANSVSSSERAVGPGDADQLRRLLRDCRDHFRWQPRIKTDCNAARQSPVTHCHPRSSTRSGALAFRLRQGRRTGLAFRKRAVSWPQWPPVLSVGADQLGSYEQRRWSSSVPRHSRVVLQSGGWIQTRPRLPGSPCIRTVGVGQRRARFQGLVAGKQARPGAGWAAREVPPGAEAAHTPPRPAHVGWHRLQPPGGAQMQAPRWRGGEHLPRLVHEHFSENGGL